MQLIFRKTLTDTMHYGKLPVLTYRIDYPFFLTTCSSSAADTVNGHYLAAARSEEAYCRTVLYPQAVETARYRPQEAPDFYGYERTTTYTVTLNQGCLTSLYLEQYTFAGGAHGSTVRSSDTWSFAAGRRLSLYDFLPALKSPFADRSALLSAVIRQASEKLAQNPGFFFEEYAQMIPKSFDAQRFYLTPDGLILYFGQYDIAPYVSGLPEFFFPWKKSFLL